VAPGHGGRLAQPGAGCRYTCRSVYAVIKTGGKQERVEEGQRLAVERLGAADGDEVSLAPVLLVDGGTVLATPAELSGVRVTARVVGEEKGPKVRGFVYKSKSRQRRSWGHRQRYNVIEVTAITREA
jgi:large subunit ribosomal protein L21